VHRIIEPRTGVRDLTHCTHLLRRELRPAAPLWEYADQPDSGNGVFLLDSALPADGLGRYTLLGLEPAALLTARRQAPGDPAPDGWRGPGRAAVITRTTWRTAGGDHCPEPLINRQPGDPLLALRNLLAEYRPLQSRAGGEDPLPFTAGLVGYFGYETAHFVEDLPDQGTDDLGVPDLAFWVIDEVAAHDHQTGLTVLNVVGRGPDPARARQDAETRATCWQKLLCRPPAPATESDAGSPGPVRAHFDARTYSDEVQRCREHILAGDVFEVCLTHRLEADLEGRPWELYRRLRAINPAPFASWLQFPELQIISASPERFLSLNAGGRVQSRPIKGTRPRGSTPAEDRALRAELATAEKDRAENLMIVDLVRSDLGRVAEIGSVCVPELLAVEEYATVFQLVSTVEARLRKEFDAFDLVSATFPGGSMTGAPKIEALKIIDRLEPVKRGVYSGAIGYIDHSGAMDLAMVIRTLVCRGGRATCGVGGAVVADSDPVAEYRETLDKARAPIRALGLDPDAAHTLCPPPAGGRP